MNKIYDFINTGRPDQGFSDYKTGVKTVRVLLVENANKYFTFNMYLLDFSLTISIIIFIYSTLSMQIFFKDIFILEPHQELSIEKLYKNS